jgi:uncharacterized protein (TIGR02646 family)
MIHVVKPKTPPEILTTKGRAEARRLRRHFDHGERRFKFKRAIYAAKDVKDELKRCQHFKCAFCESSFKHTGYGDVEHFRPKAGSKQRSADPLRKPGYYWLAYQWDNLFYSCQLCNQQFKKNLFPLLNPARRAKSHSNDLSAEKPLLVHPSQDDPTQFFRFGSEVAHPVRGKRKGKTTIEVLGLNRDELIEERLRRLEDIRNLIKLCELLENRWKLNPTQENANELEAFRDKLRRKRDKDSPYSAMARDYLDSVGLPP